MSRENTRSLTDAFPDGVTTRKVWFIGLARSKQDALVSRCYCRAERFIKPSPIEEMSAHARVCSHARAHFACACVLLFS